MIHLYNLEAREIVTKQELATLAQTFNDIEMQSVSFSIVSELEDEYDILFSEFTDSNVIIAKENMKMRME
jgi:hypothetical protein